MGLSVPLAVAPNRDFKSLRDRSDLREVVIEDLGQPNADGRWLCPFHDDTRPDLAVSKDRTRFKCFACDTKGDVFDWYQLHRGIEIAQAYDEITGAVAPPSRQTPVVRATTAPRPAPAPAWLDPDWQAEADKLICRAEEQLASDVGHPARDWLNARGIDGTTIRRFRLGYMPEDRWSRALDVLAVEGKPRKIWSPRGIVIPWLAPGCSYQPPRPGDDEPDQGPRWVGANVRRLEANPGDPLSDGPKYHAFAGSTRGFAYPWPDLDPSQGDPPAVILEGEFDALVAEQECGHLAYCTTIGGGQVEPRTEAKAALDRCPIWLVATDRDRTGVRVALEWHRRELMKVRRLLMPQGKDLTDFRTACPGTDLAAWLKAEIDKG